MYGPQVKGLQDTVGMRKFGIYLISSWKFVLIDLISVLTWAIGISAIDDGFCF